jgi:hypothetical protein
MGKPIGPKKVYRAGRPCTYVLSCRRARPERCEPYALTTGLGPTFPGCGGDGGLPRERTSRGLVENYLR